MSINSTSGLHETLKVADGGPRATSAQSPPAVTALQSGAERGAAHDEEGEARAPSVEGIVSGTSE